MQRLTPTASATPTFPSFSANIFTINPNSPSRPTTRDGGAGIDPLHPPPHAPPPIPGTSLVPAPLSASIPASASILGTSIPKEARKLSFSRKSSLSGSIRRRGSSVGSVAVPNAVVTDAAAPPALPDYALPAAAKVQQQQQQLQIQQQQAREARRELGSVDDSGVRSPGSPTGTSFTGGGIMSRTATSTTLGQMMPPPPPTPLGISHGAGGMWQQSEASVIYQQITEVASKRISTLDYLRKAHEGRVYWFNTYLFERPDLARMSSFEPRKLARKATNYLLLGLSIPTINDLYSSTPSEFLRCLNALLSEFDSFQQIHGDSSAAALARARLPTMFRRPGGKSRRSTSAADMHLDDSHSFPQPGLGGTIGSGGAAATSAPSVMNFAASESDLLPGEEYTYLLTPALPFEPDFFETFATLCDVLIDCYSRFLALMHSPRECSAPVAELFTKADSKLRKIIVQGIVKEFEEHGRSHVKTEVASIGKVVLGGLM
ncbi:uncharacterized protein CPUR_02596 [Claviceps purpurea 20.1]|uniref:Uncharacterized protein n=1 Tax=Claviceps purpurea (strain 20.1) TaxID=1111077 RepID=M1W064_CLAP2|nr:hypothetical protein E4U28_002225 [Claviceps purpurea]CCE28906.1 uncharacterized protein CPUR_02596 [Claviceps purpurea 20.1]KAG6157556.1 hypothetical protein E4U37_007222 [Claviceps purpurea]KAG6163543.1 hypothetical protein E4U11_001853 [Claviceps purpurea]KAG6168809.1 hypothetical protein E4U51_001911 [Claviceps purpurea]